MDVGPSLELKSRLEALEAERRLLAQIHRSALTIAELRYVAARLRSNRTRLADLLEALEGDAQDAGG
jgi:predicted nucleic acid-binding protein